MCGSLGGIDRMGNARGRLHGQHRLYPEAAHCKDCLSFLPPPFPAPPPSPFSTPVSFCSRASALRSPQPLRATT
eukprot:366178-Chlamydomonas_euryale.AAC.9